MWGPHKRVSCNPNAGPPPPKDPHPCRSTPASVAADTRRLLVDRDMTPTCGNSDENSKKETRPCHHNPAWKRNPEREKQTSSYSRKSQDASTRAAKSNADLRTATTWNGQRTWTTRVTKVKTKLRSPPSADSIPFRAKVD